MFCLTILTNDPPVSRVNVCLIPGPSLLLNATRRQGALRQQRGGEIPHQAAPAPAASTRQRSQVSV